MKNRSRGCLYGWTLLDLRGFDLSDGDRASLPADLNIFTRFRRKACINITLQAYSKLSKIKDMVYRSPTNLDINVSIRGKSTLYCQLLHLMGQE